MQVADELNKKQTNTIIKKDYEAFLPFFLRAAHWHHAYDKCSCLLRASLISLQRCETISQEEVLK